MKHTLAADQRRRLSAIVSTYAPDLHDPGAVEVLLMVLEICHILALAPAEIEQIFTPRVLAALRSWQGPVVFAPGHQPPPQQLQHVWVWRPERGRPKLYPVAPGGTIRIRRSRANKHRARRIKTNGQAEEQAEEQEEKIA